MQQASLNVQLFARHYTSHGSSADGGAERGWIAPAALQSVLYLPCLGVDRYHLDLCERNRLVVHCEILKRETRAVIQEETAGQHIGEV
jgi:hypothetical protein